MIIGSLQKFSLLDYPGKISAIVFTQGCNFRCQFCYNPMLVWPISDRADEFRYDSPGGDSERDRPSNANVNIGMKEGDLFQFLKQRQSKLDAVVITGGEPTIHKDLLRFVKKIKDLGFKVKLDTNGTNPKMLERLIKENLLDYIAMDVKAGPKNYEKVIGIKIDLKKIKKSVTMIIKSGLPYEFRTTVVPDLMDKEDIKEIGKMIKGADKWFLQNFKSNTDLINKEFSKKRSFTEKEMKDMEKLGSEYVKFCKSR